MQWFRMYTDARNDARLRSLSDAQFRTWFNLLSYAAERDASESESSRGVGVIPGMDFDLLAIEVSGGDAELLTSTLERLEKLQIIALGDEDDTITFIRLVNQRSGDDEA